MDKTTIQEETGTTTHIHSPSDRQKPTFNIMRLGRTESGGGSERRILRSALFVVGALALLSLPSIYFSTHVSRGADIADILHALSLDYHNNATTATTNNSETQSFGRQQEPDQARDGSVEQLQLRPAGAVSGVTPHDREKPLVAVVVCTKSSKDWLSVSQTSLHTLLIPSVEKTVTVHDLRKYRIEFVIGFDQGDEFWEQEDHRAELSGESLFPISFVSIPKDPNRPHKIPFNQLCRSAYEYGADYIVRVNDDSEFKTPDFISKSVSRLLKFDPPNVGVVGPTCKQGNTEVREIRQETNRINPHNTSSKGSMRAGVNTIDRHDGHSRT